MPRPNGRPVKGKQPFRPTPGMTHTPLPGDLFPEGGLPKYSTGGMTKRQIAKELSVHTSDLFTATDSRLTDEFCTWFAANFPQRAASQDRLADAQIAFVYKALKRLGIKGE